MTGPTKRLWSRFIYYGASVEFFFVVLTLFLILTAVGIWKKRFMWGVVRGLEGFANALGRFVAWAGLIMVMQQIVIIFLQRVFRVSSIEFGPFAPFGYPIWDKFTLISYDLSWWSEELKLYNALIVTLCVTYTFVQGGHVRVDLMYANVSFRTKKVIDMLGSIFFMMTGAIMTWLFAWFFMWRSLITPKVSASDSVDLLLRKSKIMQMECRNHRLLAQRVQRLLHLQDSDGCILCAGVPASRRLLLPLFPGMAGRA